MEELAPLDNNIQEALSSTEELKRLAMFLENFPSVECHLSHMFAPGVYLREIFMPANTFVMGREHKTMHFNIVLTGSARIMVDTAPDGIQILKAPSIFVSKAGVMKIMYILEDMRWITIHSNSSEERNLEILESSLVNEKPEADEKMNEFAKKFVAMMEVEQ